MRSGAPIIAPWAGPLACAWVLLVPAASQAAVPDQASVPAARPAFRPVAVVGEIDRIVRQHYYARGTLGELRWEAAVARARQAVADADGPGQRAAFRELLATLSASHTEYYSRDEPAYWQMWGIFEPYLRHACPKAVSPPSPLTVVDIGVLWKAQEGGGWLVAAVHAGGPADKAGLKAGDEIVSVENVPFSAPISAFAGKAGMTVAIGVRRGPQSTVLQRSVVPEAQKPNEELRKATQDSWRVIQRGSRKIAYFHVWSWAGQATQDTVQALITQSNKVPVDGFVLDIRDGWGGADAQYLTIFDKEVPVLEEVRADGGVAVLDNAQIRKPAVILINGGTRSGKEVIAYGAKKHHLARLVGERTAGAVLGGQPFCLSDGALLLLAVADARVDGERLEGVGVEPDVTVALDLARSDGEDRQLEKAVELLQ